MLCHSHSLAFPHLSSREETPDTMHSYWYSHRSDVVSSPISVVTLQVLTAILEAGCLIGGARICLGLAASAGLERVLSSTAHSLWCRAHFGTWWSLFVAGPKSTCRGRQKMGAVLLRRADFMASAALWRWWSPARSHFVAGAVNHDLWTCGSFSEFGGRPWHGCAM